MSDFYAPSYGNAPYDEKPDPVENRFEVLFADIDQHDRPDHVVVEILEDAEILEHLESLVRSVCNTGKVSHVESLQIRINELYREICKREANKAAQG